MKELEWVDLLKTKVKKSKEVLKGIGDDCALVKLGNEKILLKSDLFIEGIHFNKAKISLCAIGMRAVGRVLSDFAACGGEPKFIGISIGAPSNMPKKDLKKILQGVVSYGKKYKFSLVGGDTSKSNKLFLDVWGLGTTKKFISRSGAKKEDYIFLTGKLGRAKFNQAFKPRIKEAKILVRDFKINSMIDISDGFAIDLYRILKESNKGALIQKEILPLTKGFNDIYRGEDYELIFTVDKKEPKIEELKRKYYFVGKIELRSFGFKIKEKNLVSRVRVRGYTHF